MNQLKILIISLVVLLLVVTVIMFSHDDPSFDDDAIVTNHAAMEDAGVDKEDIVPVSVRKNLEVVVSGGEEIADKFAIISSLNRKGKIQFLDDVFTALQGHGKKGAQVSDYFKDTGGLSTVLAQLALDDDKHVSARALFIINLLALTPHLDVKMLSSSNQTVPQPASASQSVEIKAALEQLILDENVDDDIRGPAIDAHSSLYPPDDVMMREFERLIVRGGIDDGDTLTAIFDAYTKYKRKYNYDMPASTLEAAKKLIGHPSGTVKADALYVLRENVGRPILPLLFNELKTTRGIGLVNIILMDILALDNSDETVRQLKEIAAKSPGEIGKVRLIRRHTHPENLQRLRTQSDNKK